jgi:23S rRNA (cytidine1920-2'-O)/16S rRNA (cytidine1409-2'-O)-methyltransferase
VAASHFKPATLANTRQIRLDRLIVERELAESRAKAQALILAGQVLVNGQKSDKPGSFVSPDSNVRILGRHSKFASRAGFKLEGALAFFKISPEAKVCMDIGSSTGGFTDCLLQHGARKVFAVDVGTNQLIWKMRQDPRVVCLERTNARYLQFDQIGEQVDLITIDVSFISVNLILPVLPQFLRRGGEVLVLVKPQFEVGREHVSRSGVIRDAQLQQEAVRKASEKLSALGFSSPRAVESVLPGASGNREYLVYATWPGGSYLAAGGQD